MEHGELACLLAIQSLNGFGSRSLGKLKRYFGSFQNCFAADSQDLYASFLSPEQCDRIVQARKELDPFRLLHEVLVSGARITTIQDPDYPALLAQIHDPPYLLYYQGQLDCLEKFCIAVVGSRKASSYGRTQSRRFGRELVAQGMVVVSGMARGIDTEAHRGALEAGGQTAAILGSGLDVIYPPENGQLFHEIAGHGVVISEFPLHAPPEPRNFPIRNRIISGLSRGILVIEAQQRSGALITVDFALEQGRDVFALPGPVNSKNSEGTNNLIKQGAVLVTEANDIISEYQPVSGGAKRPAFIQDDLFALDHTERQILNCLDNANVHFDDIIVHTGLSIGVLSTCLLQMELKGIIKALPGNYYEKV